jgi:predicted DNA-binding protein
MAQMAIYIDNQLAERLEKAVKASGKSKSKWVAEAIRRSLQDEWPEGFFELAGKWEDDVGPEEILDRIRKGIGEHDKRESLF